MAKAVAGIVNYNGKILIGKKRRDSLKFLAGKWHIPGETIKENESDEEALIRGMREEVSLEIKVGKYICSSISPTSKKEVRWYECFSDVAKIIPSSDLEDALWIEKKDIFCMVNKEAYSLWPKEIMNYFNNVGI